MASPKSLLHTPLFELHREMGARFTPFAGYEMPLYYRSGILKEHLYTREFAGLFDVSHMGQIVLRPRGGDIGAAQKSIERLVPADIVGLAPGHQRYTVFTNPKGGVIDDLTIGHCGDHLLLVVNASRKEIDFSHLNSNLSGDCIVELLQDRALIAVQGPASEHVLMRIMPEVRDIRFLEIRPVALAGVQCTVSRSGYTGEDGFEITLPARAAESLAQQLLAQPETALVGLGARDSLRMEAGLCLYGADLDETTTPIEAGLSWAIAKSRRTGGVRAGNFPGIERVLAELDTRPERLRVGLRPADRTILRATTELLAEAPAAAPIGKVTSGGFGASVNGPVAMGYIPFEYASPNTLLFAEVRGRRVPVTVVPLPFVPHRYKR